MLRAEGEDEREGELDGSVEVLAERKDDAGRVRSLGERNFVLGGTSGRGMVTAPLLTV